MNSIQKKLIGSIIIILIILSLFIWLAILPFINKIKQLSYEYLNKQEILVQLDQREFLFRNLENSYKEKKEDIDNIEGTLLTEKETVFIDMADYVGNIVIFIITDPNSMMEGYYYFPETEPQHYRFLFAMKYG